MNASANASKLADEMMRLTGKAREIIEGKLRVETEKATEAERHLAETERELADLKGLAADRAWVVAALSSFGKVWEALSLPNRGASSAPSSSASSSTRPPARPRST